VVAEGHLLELGEREGCEGLEEAVAEGGGGVFGGVFVEDGVED